MHAHIFITPKHALTVPPTTPPKSALVSRTLFKLPAKTSPLSLLETGKFTRPGRVPVPGPVPASMRAPIPASGRTYWSVRMTLLFARSCFDDEESSVVRGSLRVRAERDADGGDVTEGSADGTNEGRELLDGICSLFMPCFVCVYVCMYVCV